MDAMMQACQKAIGCMLFEGVEQAQAMQLLQTFAQLQTFEKGQIIYSPGHYQHSLGIIVRGRTVVSTAVLIVKFMCFQCAFVLVSVVSFIGMYGNLAANNPTIIPFIVLGLVINGCSILFLSMEQMRQILLQNPVIAFNYIRFLSGRIQFLNRKIDSFTAPGAQQALLSYLRQQPGGKSVGLSMVKLSEMLNIGRTSLYRAVEQLEQCGKIKREGKTIQLMPESPSPEER